jgi:redox-sensitive bicupin YhaK (pirin superfamily)
LKKAADADGVIISAATATRALLIAGEPLGETIVQYGPFVMNSQQEIFKAISDFREGNWPETDAAKKIKKRA